VMAGARARRSVRLGGECGTTGSTRLLAMTTATPASPAAQRAGETPPGGLAGHDAAEVVLRAIHERRSASGWLPEEPPRGAIETLLAAANRAPNHKLTQPWRFVVLRGDVRLQYASALAEDQIAHQRSKGGATAPEWDAQCRQALALNLLRAPVTIAVASVPAGLAELPDWEEHAATAAAVENLLLAAHALGLGAAWKSRSCSLPAAVAWLGLPAHAQLLGHVLLGYSDPATPPKSKDRRPYQQVTTWLGWDE
jgi:nitroreductase